MRSTLAALGCLCTAVFDVDAVAAPLRPIGEAVVVHFDGQCIDAQRLVPRIRFWLKGESLDSGLAIEVRGRDEPHFELSFLIYLHSGLLALRRFDELTGPCADRLDALGLSIATTVDASGVLRGQTAQPEVTAKEVASPPARSASSTLEMATAVWLSQTPIPGGSMAGELDLTWRREPSWTVTLGGLAALPSEIQVGSGRTRLSSFAVRGQGCAWGSLEHFRVRGALCASVIAGILSSRSQSLPQAHNERTQWWVAEPRALAELALARRLRIFLAVGLPLALRRSSLDELNADGNVSASRRAGWWGGAVASGFVMVWP